MTSGSPLHREGPARVLVVDDDEVDFRATRRNLQRAGSGAFEIEWRRTIDDGLSAIREDRFDVCILDYNLGVHTGLELLRQVAAEERSIPVIVLTGQGGPSVDLDVMEAGAAEYLDKAMLTPETLERTIRYALRNHRTLEALRHSEAMIRGIVDMAMDCIITIDADDRVMEFNPAAERTFGYRRDEVIGRTLADLILPESFRLAHVQGLRRYREAGEAPVIGQRMEVTALRADGTAFPVELAITRIDGDGETRFTGFIRDITERVEAERKRHRLMERLGEANREIQSFAYNVSHDLRSPLNSVAGFAGVLRTIHADVEREIAVLLPLLDEAERTRLLRALRQDAPEALDFIEASVGTMGRLIEAVLRYSRAGRRELLLEPVDTAALVTEAIQSLGFEIEDKGIIVTREDLPTIRSDRLALQQVFGNLLGNAVKYLDSRRPGRIAVTWEDDGGDTVFRVTDNGRGIAEKDIPHIFDLFCRVGRQDTVGEGMGLAYVQSIIRRLGGWIRCESTPGIGSVFVFSLPKNWDADNDHGKHDEKEEDLT